MAKRAPCEAGNEWSAAFGVARLYPGLDARQIHTELNDLTEYVTQRVSALESQLDSARHLADFRQAQVDTLRAESSDSIAALEAQLADSSAVLTAVYQSRSWKLTKVLRWFSSKFYRSNQEFEQE